MRTLVSLLTTLVILAGIVALWGFKTTERQESPPIQTRLLAGDGRLHPVDGDASALPTNASLRPGDGVELAAGASLFLAFADGSAGRLLGPAFLEVDESSRSIFVPAPLSRIVGGGKKPGRLRTATRLGLAQGELEVEVGPLPSADSLFEIEAPGLLVRADEDVLRVSARPPDESSVEVTQGAAQLAFAAGTPTGHVPVVVPEMPAIQGITISPAEDSPAANEVLGIARQALGSAVPDRVGDFLFETGERVGLRFWVGTPTGSARGPERLFQGRKVKPIGPVLVEGAKVETWTEERIQSAVPGASIDIRPGNAADVTVGGADYFATGWVEVGKLRIGGLPLGVDVGRFLANQPYILRLVTDDTSATVSYLDSPQEAAPDPPVPSSLPHSNDYFSHIPSPREINTEWQVLATNAGLAGLTAALVLLLVSFANEIPAEGETLLENVGSAVGRLIRRVLGGRRSAASGALSERRARAP